MKLSEEEITQALEALPGWAVVGGRLEKTYAFSSYADGAAFAFRVALMAEKRDHHPDLLGIGWKKVQVAYVTHSKGGITALDLEAAKAADAVYTKFA
ncbi:putative pterin-4-alpha-carbinolamine dehydratase [Calidithermus terrae]|uniref:4a-hydroxytetrahydrobiopterin dehydratase n=1 Tax=Calidithermus terrae TaxID=1408545 RepID=A0A399EFV3_9DEIN|nr:4a-hydroxytetrahydrobiopterin dehydratase [Calidithermus terrae]RIH81131.1 putative pterin-4-alpha-carbinolamine dehydratase [Calidithermus terrae]